MAREILGRGFFEELVIFLKRCYRHGDFPGCVYDVEEQEPIKRFLNWSSRSLGEMFFLFPKENKESKTCFECLPVNVSLRKGAQD